MDEAIIERWNAKVKPQDQIWHLGDFAFHSAGRIHGILKRLNGHKHFIWGNHDQAFEEDKTLLNYFESVNDYKEVKWNKQKIVLIHYPLLTWNKGHRGAWHLHGHCHGSINHMNTVTTRIDVGVDNFDYAPVSFDEIAEIMKTRVYEAVDHHEAR